MSRTMHTSMDKIVDIAVIGAGPAGLMAARVAAYAGADVLLMEKEGWIGGRLGLQVQPLQGPRSIYRGRDGVTFCRRLLDEADSAGAEVTLNTAVSGIVRRSSEEQLRPSGEGTFFTLILNRLADDDTPDGPPQTVRARLVILATGSWEPRLEFSGSALPGVMLSGEAQVMMRVRGVSPGRRAIMIGSDNAGLLIASNLMAAGVEMAAVIDEAPRSLGREVNATPLRDQGVDILTSTRLVAAHGRDAVESATVVRLDSDGTVVPGTERHIDVDTICLAGPRTPESDLAVVSRCPLRNADALGGPVPVHDRRMATPVSGLYLCGDAAGVENGAVSLETGRLAGLWAARELGYFHADAESQKKLARGRLGYLRRGRRGLLSRRAKADLAIEYRRISQA